MRNERIAKIYCSVCLIALGSVNVLMSSSDLGASCDVKECLALSCMLTIHDDTTPVCARFQKSQASCIYHNTSGGDGREKITPTENNYQKQVGCVHNAGCTDGQDKKYPQVGDSCEDDGNYGEPFDRSKCCNPNPEDPSCSDC